MDIVELLRENADLDAAEHVPDEVVQMQIDAANEIERLRAALSGLLDRNITYSGSDVILPFASHGMAVKQVADARRMMTPNAGDHAPPAGGRVD